MVGDASDMCAGALPLRGTIPDMTADTKCYIGLQNVYREQQEQDIAAVNNNVQQLLTSLGRVSHFE